MIPLRSYLPVLFVALLAGTVPAAAQESGQDLSPRASNRAISFSFDGLRLGEIDGGVGGKWWISPSTALRASLNFMVESDEDVTEGVIDRGRSTVGGGLSFLIEWHSLERGRVSPYLGSGFTLGGSAFSETTDFGPDNPLTRSREKGSALDFEVNVALGVEVRVSRRVSLAGEHLFGAHVRVGSEKRTEDIREGGSAITERDLRNFTLSTGTSSLIVSVYF